MNDEIVCRFSPPLMVSRIRRCRAFSLVELLTVMFIISALIAILVPSLNAARNSAKKTSTIATLNALKGGLDLFRNDNERQFARTNGYPPSSGSAFSAQRYVPRWLSISPAPRRPIIWRRFTDATRV